MNIEMARRTRACENNNGVEGRHGDDVVPPVLKVASLDNS